MKKTIGLVALVLLMTAGTAWTHHGSAISYDTAHLWTTWATVTQFNYLNPHPSMRFDRTLKDGTVKFDAGVVCRRQFGEREAQDPVRQDACGSRQETQRGD